MHYLHHIIFDPLSAWERFKLDLIGTAIGGALMLAWLWKFRRNP